jgi:hypothetical protein
MISGTYDQRRETTRFAPRKESFAFTGFSASSRPKTQGSEINGGFGRAEGVAPLGDIGNGAAGSSRWAGESIRRTPYETTCTQLETRARFFYFFARNPLKSPDSDE